MQFTLLGTGPASPIARIYCKCPVCADARRPESKSRRSRSSALLTVNDRHILFDAGPDVLQQLDREKTYLIDAVFFTHAHSDAVGGFFDLKDLLFRQKYPAVLYVEPATWEKIASDVPKKEIWFKVKFIVPGRPLPIFGVSITPFRVLHAARSDFPTLGYRIGDQLVYASDVRKIPKISERFIIDVPHAVLDGCFWFGTKFPTHLTVNETIALADRLGVRNLYLTQISHNYPPYTEAVREIAQYCKKTKITTKVTLTWDGLKIDM